jgi:hypothetical protein
MTAEEQCTFMEQITRMLCEQEVPHIDALAMFSTLLLVRFTQHFEVDNHTACLAISQTYTELAADYAKGQVH